MTRMLLSHCKRDAKQQVPATYHLTVGWVNATPRNADAQPSAGRMRAAHAALD